jgi:hypothetical protein
MMDPKEERLLRDIRNSLQTISQTLIKLELHARTAAGQMSRPYEKIEESDQNGS